MKHAIGDLMSRTANAWLEIIEQILGEFHVVDNATPDWLVDAETGRRFKVDRLYPELGMAIRFTGSISAPQSAVLDEMDLMEERTRDEIRARLCHQAGIALIVIDADSDDPGKVLAEMRIALSAAARRIAQRRVAQKAKLSLLPRIASAKATCRHLQDVVSTPEDLLPFAKAWENRQFGQGDSKAPVTYQPGMTVRHSEYGKGLVLHVVPEEKEGEAEIVVQFSDGSVHPFSPDRASRELLADE
jgi:hypothetical protein